MPSGLAALLIAVVPAWVVVLRRAFGERPRPRRRLRRAARASAGLAVLTLPGLSGDVRLWGVAHRDRARPSCGRWAPSPPPHPDAQGQSLRGQCVRDGRGRHRLSAGEASAGASSTASPSTRSPRRSWTALGYLVVFGSVVAFTAYAWLLHSAPLSLVATYAYVNPVVAPQSRQPHVPNPEGRPALLHAGQTPPRPPAPTVGQRHPTYLGRAGTPMTSTHAFWLAGRQATGEDTLRRHHPLGRPPRRHGQPCRPTPRSRRPWPPRTPCGDEFAATPAHVRAAALDHVVAPARRAHRGDRPADLRRERQADQVGPRRGRPRRLRLPLRRRGGPPLQRRRGPAPRHRRRRPAAGSRCTRRFPQGRRARHRAVQLPAQPGAPTRSPRRSRSARRSSSSPPRRPRSPALVLGELLAETDLPAGSWSRAAGARTTGCPPWSRTSGCR